MSRTLKDSERHTLEALETFETAPTTTEWEREAYNFGVKSRTFYNARRRLLELALVSQDPHGRYHREEPEQEQEPAEPTLQPLIPVEEVAFLLDRDGSEMNYWYRQYLRVPTPKRIEHLTQLLAREKFQYRLPTMFGAQLTPEAAARLRLSVELAIAELQKRKENAHGRKA